VRDGREVLCSTHVWMMNGYPETRCSLQTFLRQEVRGISRVKLWAHQVSSWAQRADATIIRFEDILKDPENIIRKLANILELEPRWERPLLPKKRKHTGRLTNYWRRLTRNFESTAMPGRYNGKKPADWEKAFTFEDRKFFHEEAGDVLMEMGYIGSEQWIYEVDEVSEK